MDDDLEFDPFVDPDTRWGEPDYTPKGYNDNIQVLGSQFVAYPEHVETGLDREIGAGADELLEDEDKTNIADLLVDSRLWETISSGPDQSRSANGWYAVDFRREGDDRNYQGFLRPVDNLGWDVVMQKYDNETNSPSAGANTEIQVHSPSLNAQMEENEPEAGDYYGHFMPFSTLT